MTEKQLASVRRHSGICIYARLLVSLGLALWLMLGAVGAQQMSAGVFKGQTLQDRKDDSEMHNQINEALRAFEELLAVSKSAAAKNSHWRVRQTAWRNAQQPWEKSSGALPTPVQRLKRCAVALATARRIIERADELFLQAQDIPDPMRAVELLDQHKELLRHAKGPLNRAERCYCAARNAYLKGKRPSAQKCQ